MPGLLRGYLRAQGFLQDARRPQFRLRTLLVLLLFSGLALAYPASLIREAAQERPIVRQLQEAGAQLDYRELGPDWLRKIVGRERLQVVTGVRLTHLDDANGLVRATLKLPHLEQIHLEECDVTDEAFAELSSCEHLERIEIQGCPVGDGFLGAAAKLKSLQSLWMLRTQVTPRALIRQGALLARLEAFHGDSYSHGDMALAADDGKTRYPIPRQLWPDYSPHTEVEKSGPPALANFKDQAERLRRTISKRQDDNLAYLSIHDAQELTLLDECGPISVLSIHANIDNDDLIALRHCPDLSRLLIFPGDRFGDDGLRYLRYCPQLQALVVRARVGDAGMSHLAHLSTLRELDLGGLPYQRSRAGGLEAVAGSGDPPAGRHAPLACRDGEVALLRIATGIAALRLPDPEPWR